VVEAVILRIAIYVVTWLVPVVEIIILELVISKIIA
jgi:hypothetical protein